MRSRRRTDTAETPTTSVPETLTVKPIVQAIPVSASKTRSKLKSCTAKAKRNRRRSKKKYITGLWENIPSELLRQILSRLGLKDNIQASAVCKAWCEAAASVRTCLMQRRPWLFHPINRWSNTASPYILVDALQPHNRCKLDFPELKNHKISCSRDGWVLVRSFTHNYALFLNPFTKKRFYLPKGSDYYLGYCLAFSAAPTSTSCVVTSCTQICKTGDVWIDTWRPGEAAWTTHRFKNSILPYRRWDKCVFSNGLFYCLSTCGCLSVFDPCEATWNLLPVKPCPAFPPVNFTCPVFMTEHEGDIFVIYTRCNNNLMVVYKLNLKHNVWEEKRDLGGLTVFASCPASFIRAGLSAEERNRIYPSFTNTLGQYGMYYSLSDRKSSNPRPRTDLSTRIAWVEPPPDKC